MCRFFAALLFLLFAVTGFAQAPTISPSAPTAFKNGTISFTCTANCGTGGTWSCSGCVGSINSSTGVYTAPASIKAQQQLAGYQLLPNNAVFNVDISGLPASAITGAFGYFNLLPSFPLNYITNSTPTDSMLFFYTPGHNGTYFTPTQNNFLSGNIESGWYQARNQSPGNTDHHYLRANSDAGTYQEQYQYYPVGASQTCPTCNSASGVKYTSTSYAAPDIATDAAGLYIMPLILRRQEFDKACNGGAGGGSINHALRLTLPAGYISSLTNGFIWPAQTNARGGGTHPYGQRFRLKNSFSEAGFSACAKIILEQLKHYGLIVADIGYNWQANIEFTTWSEADDSYFGEINNAKIADSNFEQVDESSLEISSTSLEANTSRETVTFTSSSGTVTADVVLLGITVGTLQDAVDIMAGSPGIQLKAVIQGDTTINWSLSSATGSITSSGVYTPPATASSETTIRAIATSNADSTVWADTLIRIWPSGTAYALPSWSAGHDYTDSSGHIWKSGAGIGITNQHGHIGCCSADYVGLYTGPATDHQLWDHVFTGFQADYHIYWFVPAGTYTLTFHSLAIRPAGAGTSNVNFVAQGSTLASNVDFAGGGVGQYGPYTRTDSLTVGCDNLLTYDEQMYDDGGFAQISSFSITQNTNTQASCSSPTPISSSAPTAFKNGTISFTCTPNCGTGGTWSCPGCAGSINSSTGVYTAPASIKAQQQLAGYQLLPNNAVFNVDISGLPASAITGAPGNFSLWDSFPLNYVTNSTPTDSMVFLYTPGHNGTYFTPSQNSFLSGNIESGWYQARNQPSGNTDHHYLKANSDAGTYEEQYQYYPVGSRTSLGCSTCNSASGVKYTSTSYSAPDITADAAGLYIMPLILRRQEFDNACNGGVGGGSINHALRVTLPAGYISSGFIWPAQTNSPGGGTHSNGERFRLKSSFNEAGFSPCARIILEELKHYGLIVAGIGLNWQANTEFTTWSEADEGYFAEINDARITDSNFEQVDESGLEISSTSLEANTSRETVTFTSSSGTRTTEVVLLGITVGTLQDAVDIMAGSPGIQLKAVIQGDTKINWSLSSATGSITSSGVYTPPATASSETTIRAIATSNADSTVSADTLIRIWPNGTAYALPSWSTGHDYTDSGGHIWKSGAGIGITNQHGQIRCCSADHVGQYTGPATDHQLWDHVFTGWLNNEADYHIYWFVPAGTYTLTFHSLAPAPAGAGTNNVNFVAQGSMLASNVDFASVVGQYGPYTRTDSLTVGCDNLLTYDVQMHDDSGFAQISSFSITQNTNTQASCSP